MVPCSVKKAEAQRGYVQGKHSDRESGRTGFNLRTPFSQPVLPLVDAGVVSENPPVSAQWDGKGRGQCLSCFWILETV